MRDSQFQQAKQPHFGNFATRENSLKQGQRLQMEKIQTPGVLKNGPSNGQQMEE